MRGDCCCCCGVCVDGCKISDRLDGDMVGLERCVASFTTSLDTGADAFSVCSVTILDEGVVVDVAVVAGGAETVNFFSEEVAVDPLCPFVLREVLAVLPDREPGLIEKTGLIFPMGADVLLDSTSRFSCF